MVLPKAEICGKICFLPFILQRTEEVASMAYQTRLIFKQQKSSLLNHSQ